MNEPSRSLRSLPPEGAGAPSGRPGGGPQHAARNYAIVTAAYWGFTLTDEIGRAHV